MISDMDSPMSCDEQCTTHEVPPLHYEDSGLAVDQLTAVLRTEQTYAVPQIPCTACMDPSSSLPYGEWRRKICQWCFKVVDHFQLDREIVSSGMNIFDRFLASRPRPVEAGACACPACQKNIDSRIFQLAAMTSLYIAMKMYSDGRRDSPYRNLRLSAFVELSRGQFTANDISEMEQAILNELQWKVNPPTPMTVVPYLLQLMPSRPMSPSLRQRCDLVFHVLHELARYMSELSVCLGSSSFQYSPSQVAFASILVSMDLLTLHALPMSMRQEFIELAMKISRFSGGTMLSPNDSAIITLQERLRQSFWPEMLIDDQECVDPGHPIFMAREYGLLDMATLASPQTKWRANEINVHGSPVSVRGGF
ncbi:MAG: hypothetical protein SGBAC_009119 [Bacillariaceae sp.]